MDSDAEARRIWFRREVLPLEPALRAYARRFCHNGSDEVEDLVQEAFARLIACPRWHSVGNVSAFAMRTLKEVAVTAVRRRKIVSIGVISNLDGVEVSDGLPSVERIVEAREELRLLGNLIAELPPQCRKVFTLRKVYDLSHTEIAARTGLSLSAVEKHIARGLRVCTEKLARISSAKSRGQASNDRIRQCNESE
jgi:RNA polymerase sigma factor (sigma-70 family)